MATHTALLLKLTSLNKAHQQRHLSFLVNDLETGLDSLNTLASMGERLTQIRFIDEDGCIELPVAVVDGSSFSTPLHRLTNEWEQLLAQPTASQRVDSWRQRDVIEPLLAIQTKQIELLQSRLDKMLDLLETTQGLMSDGSKKMHLLAHYQVIIDRCCCSLTNATAINTLWLAKAELC